MNERTHREFVTGRRRGGLASLVRAGLWGLSFPYGWGTALRNVAFSRGWKRVERVPAPVISVGNITTGGTGKTPVAAWLARWFREQNIRVAFLSRGYRAGEDAQNDEALVLEHLCPDVPHLQNPDRVAAARVALDELEMQLLILDDGFQHRRLARDLDIVLIDALEPWGGGYLLPRGYLRESRTGLRRADLILITRVEAVPPSHVEQLNNAIRRITPNVPVATIRFVPAQPVSWSGATADSTTLATGPLGAFCGIGNPMGFATTLLNLGLSPVEIREYPDHHRYTRADVDTLTDWARTTGLSGLVTTRKDLVKLQTDRLGAVPLWCIDQQVQVVSGAAELETALARVLALVPAEPPEDIG